MPPTKVGGSFLPGQRPERRYLNSFTKLFFKELDKGAQSPIILLLSGTLLSYLAWRVTEKYLAPRRDILQKRPILQRVPMEDSHNVLWGVLNLSDAPATAQPDSGRYIVQSDNSEEAEEGLRRPQVVHSEVSELCEPARPGNPGGEVDIVCLELPEYDGNLRDDVYYRSLHYVPAGGGGASSTAPSVAHTSAEDYASGETPYLRFMPGGGGADVIHGMVKCKGVTSLNNCVPAPGHVEEEVVRKLLLTLGPVHILRDSTRSLIPTRFTRVKQLGVETLVLGLHSGELPRWLSNAFPNFNVSVVERDGTLVRVCKQFFGFQESSNLHLFLNDPTQFVKQAAMPAAVRKDLTSSAQHGTKPFDLVLINTVDGSGRLSTQYGRLDFINDIRNSMSDHGCVAVTLPNKDSAFLYNTVQNWRMGFQDRVVLLVHCVTEPYSVLLTFQDNAAKGKSNFGSVGGVDEFRDILRLAVTHYGAKRVPFNLAGEVGEENFRVLHPGVRYDRVDFLPRGHPDRLAAAAAAGQQQQKPALSLFARVSRWISSSAGTQLSVTQKADLRAQDQGRPVIK